MKKWFLKIGDTEYTCDIVAANLVTSSKLMLKFMHREFFVEFYKRSDYLSSRDGNWSEVMIYNKTKSQSKIGMAIFKEC